MKYLLFFLALAAPLVATLTRTNLYQLNVEARRMTGTVTFNGVPLVRLEGSPLALSLPINMWVHRGDNHLALSVRPVDGAARDSATYFHANLAVAWRGEKGIRSEVVWYYELPRKPDGTPSLTAGETLSGDGSLALPLHTKTWLDGAAPIRLDAAAKLALASNVAAYHRALAGGDAASLESQTLWKAEEAARLCGWPFDTDRYSAQVRGLLNKLRGFRIEPLDTARLRYTPVVDGRVVHVTSEDGRPPVVATGTNGALDFELFFGLVEGQWRLVR